jgi:hypothetical protein
MSDTYLVAPIQLDALALNEKVRSSSFRWWQFNYENLSNFRSPEPPPGIGNIGLKDSDIGICLHWTLPRSLRHGIQNRQTGGIEYPLVPNRWLILRFGKNSPQAGWVIESDCPFVDQSPPLYSNRTSQYLIDREVYDMWDKSGDDIRKSVKVSFMDVDNNPITPDSNQPLVAEIGVPFLLNEWEERAADAMFLTAMAPANDVFSMYYPHNAGVFSFLDDLQGIDNDTLSYLVVGWYSDTQKDIMASWQPDSPSTDSYKNLLDRLQWTVVGGSQEQATASLYEGMVFSVEWDRSGSPSSDPLISIDRSKINVAIGNTTIDALTALSEGGDDRKRTLLKAFQYDLLPTLNQVNGEALLDEKIRQAWYGSKPGGYRWHIVTKESDADASADLTNAEAQWLLQLNKDQSDLDEALGDLYALQWEVNALWYRKCFLSVIDNQLVFPSELGEVSDYVTKLNKQLDPAGKVVTAADESAALKLLNQMAKVQTLLGSVPQPDASNGKNAQDAFRKGIETFAKQKGLSSDDKVLKAVAAPRYWKPNNPVVLISGVEPSPAISPDLNLNVRLATSLITGFDVNGQEVNAAVIGDAIPVKFDLSNLRAPVPSLVQEYLFLDPAGAAAIAPKINQPVSAVLQVMTDRHDQNPPDYKGTLPDLNLQNWSQSWNPMFVEWRAEYSHISSIDDSPAWTFDGTDYNYTSESADIKQETAGTLSGTFLLSAHSQFIFASRLKDFVDKYAPENARLEALVEEAADWKFLSQELTGFNEQLALRDNRAYRRPSAQDVIPSPPDAAGTTYPLAELIGYGGDAPPVSPPSPYSLPAAYKGQVSSIPLISNDSLPDFHGVRQGQMYFTDLSIYDQFGRVLNIIESIDESGAADYRNFTLIADESFVVPAGKIISEITDKKITPAAVAQLPPRLLQFARLDFDLVDAKTDSEILGLDPNVNPICGWVLPNHLDGSILIYAPDGMSLGEFRLLENDSGEKVGNWQPPPQSQIKTLNDAAKIAPHLAQMIEAANIGTEENFQAFLEVIDTTLWTIDGLGNRADQNLSVLIGRPLALVRARLRFSLDGQAINDTGWASALDSPEPEFLNYDFAVRLGDQATRQDGLIGYFLGEDYETFNSVVGSETKTTSVLSPPAPFIRQIGPLGSGSNYIPLKFNEASGVCISLLADPRAGIHAFTGILPIKQLDIPPRFVAQPLARIEVGFRIGPILTTIQPTPTAIQSPPAAASYPDAVSYPFPAEQNGQWSWWEASGGDGNFNSYELLKTTTDAKFKNAPKTLRDGILQLVTNLEKDS